MRIVDAARMRTLDARTIDELGLPGMVLMERAALGVADAIAARRPAARCAVVLVGAGNNGGDGSAVARMLTARNIDVTMIVATSPERLQGDARTNFEISKRLGVPILAHDDPGVDAALRRADIVVDALLGVGVSGPPRGDIGALVARLDDVTDGRSPFVVAVDVPSGVDADTGACPGTTVRADLTVTFGYPKWGLLLPPGADRAGEVVVADIGIPPRFADDLAEELGEWFDLAAARRAWRPAPATAHKGVHGHVLVVGGCDDTPGAAVLAADAALHAGAGLVTIAGTPRTRDAANARRPEIMTAGREIVGTGVPGRFDTVVLGPGLGLDDDAERVVDAVLGSIGARPLVVDADALTLVARMGVASLPSATVLTPHPGELARLLGTTGAAVVADLRGSAAACSARYGANVLAKTAGALVVDASRTTFVSPGHPGMATAGAGDVLSGIVGALAHRHGAAVAARLGAWLHAASGRAAGSVSPAPSLVAGDLVDNLGRAFAELQG